MTQFDGFGILQFDMITGLLVMVVDSHARWLERGSGHGIATADVSDAKGPRFLDGTTYYCVGLRSDFAEALTDAGQRAGATPLSACT